MIRRPVAPLSAHAGCGFITVAPDCTGSPPNPGGPMFSTISRRLFLSQAVLAGASASAVWPRRAAAAPELKTVTPGTLTVALFPKFGSCTVEGGVGATGVSTTVAVGPVLPVGVVVILPMLHCTVVRFTVPQLPELVVAEVKVAVVAGGKLSVKVTPFAVSPVFVIVYL